MTSMENDPAAAMAPAAGSAALCYHCQLTIPRGVQVSVTLDGVARAMCCQGCAALALWMADMASVPSASMAPAAAIPQEVPADAWQRASVTVSGMVCGSCAWLIERQLQRLGVAGVQIDVARQRLQLLWDRRHLSLPGIAVALAEAGYPVVEGDATAMAVSASQTRAGPGRHADLRRLMLAWLCMMQIMMFSVPLYFVDAASIEPDLLRLMNFAQLALTLPVVIYCAWPLYVRAWRGMMLGRPGMDLPVTLGIGVAFVASLYGVYADVGTSGTGGTPPPVYFDSVAMFVALLLGARWLQRRGLDRALGYIDVLSAQAPVEAHRFDRWPGGTTSSVAATDLQEGDVLRVRAGEVIPADGVVVAGTSTCSEALLSGESRPVPKAPGSEVLESAGNLDQDLIVRVTRVGAATTLSLLQRLAQAASAARPPLLEFADRAARHFLVIVLGLVALAAMVWSQIDPSRIVPVTIAILIITCPCALSLAVPAALAAAQGALARRGVLVTRARAIEILGRVNHVVFDKTGTLTAGRMALVGILPVASESTHTDRLPAMSGNPGATWTERVLATAVALEQSSNHPIAAALRAAWREQASTGSMLPDITAAVLHTGLGVEGQWRDADEASAVASLTRPLRRMRLGEAVWAMALAGPDAAAPPTPDAQLLQTAPGCSLALLADESGALAWLALADPIRPGAAQLITALRARGLDISLLSGDRRAAVEAVAGGLGIRDAHAAMSPVDKQAWVAQRQQVGEVVAMIGDGLNDAPVIAQADVSLAFASASTLAQTRADMILLDDNPAAIRASFEICARSLHIMRLNLAWALAYNLIALPVAAVGYVSPALAGAGMAASSLLVIANALRLLPRRSGGHALAVQPEGAGIPASGIPIVRPAELA